MTNWHHFGRHAQCHDHVSHEAAAHANILAPLAVAHRTGELLAVGPHAGTNVGGIPVGSGLQGDGSGKAGPGKGSLPPAGETAGAGHGGAGAAAAGPSAFPPTLSDTEASYATTQQNWKTHCWEDDFNPGQAGVEGFPTLYIKL